MLGTYTTSFNYNDCSSSFKHNHVSRYRQFSAPLSYMDLDLVDDDGNFRIPEKSQRQSTRQARKICVDAERTNLPDEGGDICSRCKAIDFRSMTENTNNRSFSAYVLGPFESVVLSTQCPICSLFEPLALEYEREGRPSDSAFYLAAFPTSALYASNWTWDATPVGVNHTTSFSIFDEATLRDQTRILQPHLVRAIGCISPVLSDEKIDTFHARTVGAELDVSTIKAWLNFCSHNHLGSCTSSEDPLRALTKVIDCRTNDIVDLELNHTYLALSYVWGEPQNHGLEHDQTLRTVTDDLSFPQTVTDAIALTLEFGYSYLWVDRFCIPPDDDTERQIQIAQMDRIYAGAEATIIAAAGENPYHGLPGIRGRTREQPKRAMINGLVHTVIPPDPSREIKLSKWNSRAWTYQECNLSKRRIIFCKRQVYFECSGMHCYEAIRAPLHLLHSSLSSCFSEWNEPGIFPVSQHRHALDQLFHHLALYTVRHLSYPDDILNGMLGIFSAFSQQAVAAKLNRSNRRIMQIAGIPIVPNDTLMAYDPINPPVYHLSREGQFLTGLSWKLAYPAQRRSGFPSWSWTGWYGAVLRRNDSEGYIRNTHELELRFDLPNPTDKAVDLKTMLDLYSRKVLAPTYLPQLTVTGLTIGVTIGHRVKTYIGQEDPPKRLVAFMDSDNAEGYIICDRFHLTHNDPRFFLDTVYEDCIGLVLGMAQCTYFAGGDKRIRVLDDSRFPLVVLVLWEREGKWERLGIIEHTVRVRTDECPIPIGTQDLYLITERRSLRLG